MYLKRMSMFVALLFVVAGSVYYFSGNPVSETEKREGPYTDSLVADDRPSITAQVDTVPPPVGENLPPGTALVRATILTVEKNENEIAEITIQVDEIMDYGSSTPPISTGTEFSFDVLHYLKHNPEFGGKISTDSEIKVLISYQESIKMDDSKEGQNWTFVKIKDE